MPIGSDVQLSVTVQLFTPKELQKEHLSSAPMSPDSTLTKEPLQMPPFHMRVTTAILVFQANPVRIKLFTSYVRGKHTLSNCLTRVKALYRLLTFYT